MADETDPIAAETGDGWPPDAKFARHAWVRVKPGRGPEWQGTVCGWYRAPMTPLGYAVLSDSHKGAVQLYAEGRLEGLPNGR